MSSQKRISQEAAELVTKLELSPHPEGGYFKQTHASTINVSLQREAGSITKRAAGTSIYYLLDQTDFSAFHRLKSEETWYHHSGGELIIHIIDAEGNLSQRLLGDPLQAMKAEPQTTIPPNVWFAAELVDKGQYCLAGCAVYPGFSFEDFEMGQTDSLVNNYPEHHDLIERLTHRV